MNGKQPNQHQPVGILTAEWRERSRQEGFLIAKVTADSGNRQRVEVELKMR